MNEIEDNFTDIQLQSSVEDKGKFYVIAQALTTDFECKNGLNALAKDIIRQAVTWRHSHPIQGEHKNAHIFGRVVEARVDDSLVIKAELYDHTQDHRDLIQIIKKRDFVKDPLGWSMHFRTYRNEEGVKYHWDVFELAGTPTPACKNCKTIEMGVIKMEKNKTKEELELEEKQKFEKALEEIKDLESKLNIKTNSLEDLKSKVEKLESDTKIKDKALESAKGSAKTMEDRVLEMESKITYLETKKPIMDKLLEANPDIDEKELTWLRSMDSDYLEKRLERDEKKAENKIHTQELEDSADKAKAEKDKEDKALEDTSYETFTSALDLAEK